MVKVGNQRHSTNNRTGSHSPQSKGIRKSVPSKRSNATVKPIPELVTSVAGFKKRTSGPVESLKELKEYQKWALAYIRPSLAHLIDEARRLVNTKRSEQKILELISKPLNRHHPKTMALALEAIYLGLQRIDSYVLEMPITEKLIHSTHLDPITAYALHRLSWMADGNLRQIEMLANLYCARLTGSHGMVQQVYELIRLSEVPLSTRDNYFQRKLAAKVFPSVGCTNDAKNLAFEALAKLKRTSESGTFDNMTLKEEDITSLQYGTRISDRIVNFFLHMIQERAEDIPKRWVHVFPPKFYSDLAAGGYEAARKYTKDVNIFERDNVLIPICQSNHWSLCLFTDAKLHYYDSKGGQASTVLEKIRQFLRRHWQEKFKENPPHMQVVQEKCNSLKREQNSAVFMCKHADYLLSHRASSISNISAATIDYFRYQMMYEIVTGSMVKNYFH